ncbi:prepilin peptidase [Iocasia frigidifontis]|uniref:Prepilin leader peptidase/N-methyltransferase n=1 Tax=Iocasia fonsfrigidae TaxID=2682810 RepID=A0A8A7KAS5_9FIRM|nr:A24 family peptidase [Iocasia fonsfrigidae]QTL98551.1 prepilin peptidase [Iocasia fonsfrigidae]
MLLYSFIFLLGTVIGSFLNVLIYRLPRQESIIAPPSHCPECGEYLKVRDLIPMLSFLLNRGKCRYCAKAISWQYPVVEVLTAFLLTILYHNYGLNISFIIYSILICILIVCSLIDLQYKIIPNKLTYPALITALISSIFLNHISLMGSLTGILVPGGLFLLLALLYGKGLGMGDVKLVAVIGAVIGWQFTLIGIFLASLIGSITGLVLMIAGIMDRKTRIPFAPFIGLGTIISLFYGEELFSILMSLY